MSRVAAAWELKTGAHCEQHYTGLPHTKTGNEEIIPVFFLFPPSLLSSLQSIVTGSSDFPHNPTPRSSNRRASGESPSPHHPRNADSNVDYIITSRANRKVYIGPETHIENADHIIPSAALSARTYKWQSLFDFSGSKPRL